MAKHIYTFQPARQTATHHRIAIVPNDSTRKKKSVHAYWLQAHSNIRPHSAVTWSKANASNQPDSDCVWSRRFGKQATNENTIVHDQTKTIDTPIDQAALSYHPCLLSVRTWLLTLVSIHTSAHDAEQRTTHVTPSFVSDQSGRQTSKKGSDLRLHAWS